jgi:hypothetical protein
MVYFASGVLRVICGFLAWWAVMVRNVLGESFFGLIQMEAVEVYAGYIVWEVEKEHSGADFEEMESTEGNIPIPE